MARKAIGGVLAVLGGLMAIVLLTGGGPLLPHIIGPVVLVTVGVILIVVKGATKQSPEA